VDDPETADACVDRAYFEAKNLAVAQRMPERVLFPRDLPKTRSAKIMRRVIRATYLGKEPGDLSSLENPAAVQAVAEAE